MAFSIKTTQKNVKVLLKMTDIMELVPEFTGAKGEKEYVYFYEGCMNALTILGDDNQKLLLMFLKTKLKGNARTGFTLRLTTYESLEEFLSELKDVYAVNSDELSCWMPHFFELKQGENESLQEFASRFLETYQCGISCIQYEHKQLETSADDVIERIQIFSRMIAQHFFNGLKCRPLRRELKAKYSNVKNFVNVIKAAMEIQEDHFLEANNESVDNVDNFDNVDNVDNVENVDNVDNVDNTGNLD